MGDGVQDIGALVTAGLASREIDRGGGGSAVAHAHGGQCANCGATLIGAHCHQCGQAGHVHKTAGAILHDIGHSVFHFEGRVWHTLPLLAWRPGELTRRYIDGERVRFVSPIALFLFSVFLMFASIGLITHAMTWGEGLEGNANNLRTSLAKAQVDTEKAIAELTRERQAAVKASRPAEVARIDRRLAKQREDLSGLEAVAPMVGKTEIGGRSGTGHMTIGWGKLDKAVSHALDNPQLALYKIKSAAYKYSWALIPISLPFIWLLFPFSRRYGLYDHAIFATYSLAFMTLLVVTASVAAWAGVAPWLIWTALVFVPPWHIYRQIKGAYRLGRFGALWRTGLLLVFTIFTVTFFTLLLLYLGLA